jgi:hypothetical protein
LAVRIKEGANMLRSGLDWLNGTFSWASPAGRPRRNQGNRREKWARLELTRLEDRLAPTLSSIIPPPPTLVDVIPRALSGETDQNSEPNIAVNPANRNQAAIGAFADAATNPYFSTQNGGVTWTNFQNLVHGDETVAWTPSGNLYASLLENTVANSVTTFRSVPPNNPPTLIPINTFTRTDLPDQPWVEATTVGGLDHIYVAYNDLSNFNSTTQGTASVQYSTNSGASWRNVVLDKLPPLRGQDSPAVRLAVTGNTVYAVFDRLIADVTGGTTGDLVVVKDTNGGNGPLPFTALGTNGALVARIIEPLSTTLGSNRNAGSFSIAVDPNNPNRVALEYVTLNAAGGRPHVEVRLSTNGGVTWSGPLFVTASPAGMPAIRFAGNGTLGLLYQRSVGTRQELHFVQSNDNLATNTDQMMFSWVDGVPPPTFQPYIGDYFDLNAVGNTFYGVFSASNALNTAVLPFGIHLQRNFVGTPGQSNFALRDLAGAPVAFSIDPFFFRETALQAPVAALKLFFPLRYIYDPATDTFRGNLTLANLGTTTFQGPFTLVFPQLPPGVTLVNPTGVTGAGFTTRGLPFIRVAGTLLPGTTLRVQIVLRNPLHVPMSTFYIPDFPVIVLLG